MSVHFKIPLLINASGDVVVYSEDVSGDFFDVDYVLDVLQSSQGPSLTAAAMKKTFYFTDASANAQEKLFAIDVGADATMGGGSAQNGPGLTPANTKASAVIDGLYTDCMDGGTEHGGGKLHLMHSLVSHWAPGFTDAAGQAPFGRGTNEKIATATDSVNLGELMVRYLSAVLLGDYKNQAVIKDDTLVASKINDEIKMKDQLVKIFMTDGANNLMANYVDGSSNNHVASDNAALLSIWEFMKANGRYNEVDTVHTFQQFDFRAGDTFSIYIQVNLDLLRNTPITHTPDDAGDALDAPNFVPGGVNSTINFKNLFLGTWGGDKDNFMEEGAANVNKMKSKIWKIRWTLN